MHNFDADARKIRRTSAGAVVLRQCEGRWMALVLRAWSHWDFPKGNVEVGETLMQAAVREVHEETGVCDLSFPWGEAFARTSIYSKDKVAYYSLALTDTECVSLDANPITGETEHDEFRWVPWEELPALLSPRLRCILEWASLLANLPVLDFSKFAELQVPEKCVGENKSMQSPRSTPRSAHLQQASLILDEAYRSVLENKANPVGPSVAELKKEAEKPASYKKKSKRFKRCHHGGRGPKSA